MILSGSVRETVGSGLEIGSALCVSSKDAGVMHANDWGATGARVARLVLGCGTLAELADVPTGGAPWRWSRQAPVTKAFVRLINRASREGASFAADDADVVDLLALFTATAADAPRGAAPAWLSDALRYMREQWVVSLRVAAVAAHAHVHPVYLARCMRRWYGMGVNDELRRLRCAAAMTAIVEGGDTFSAVAHACGYADEPHLHRSIRHHVGVSPKQLRRSVRALSFR
jgi:AraC family transcriptional regulator